jgi:thiamine kinase-like enzyme
MLAELLDRLANEWAPESPRLPLSAIKLAGSGGQARKVNFLVFENQARLPSYLVKVTRDSEFQSQLADEFSNLQYVFAHPSLQAHLPRPLGLFEHRQILVMLETCVPGIALENLLWRGQRHSSAEIATDLEQVRVWLEDFWRETRTGTITFEGRSEIENRLTQLDVRLPAALQKGLLSISTEVQGNSIPLTARHGDFWPGNLMISHAGLGVIDWETLARAVSPLHDLFFFAVTYAMRHSRGTDAQRFAFAFLQKNPFSAALAAMLRKALASLGIPPGSAGLFFTIFLIDMASNAVQLGRTGKKDMRWTIFLEKIPTLDELVL